MSKSISIPSTNFLYSPLLSRQIRILTLHSGESNSPIVITLQIHDLYIVKDTYEALSYVWGDSTRSVAIECNGAELKITKSLHLALRQIRYPDKSRLLWVDLVCINQDDLDEREDQIPLMKSIYPMASTVLVWLGEADDKTESAINAIEEWATFNRHYRYDNCATQFSKFEEQFAFRPDYRDTLEAVGKLTNRPWFNRCWTFQEIILSSQAEIHVGKFQLNWDWFNQALEAFPMHLLADNVLNNNALFMCYGKAKKKNSASTSVDSIPESSCLSRVLMITRKFLATDPRDKIFAVLSMATMKNPSNYQPNYKKTVWDTYVSSTLAMIKEENSLNVLISTGGYNRDKSLPSWCPDWSSKRGITVTGYFESILFDINAGLRPDLTQIQMNENHELVLDGVLIDVVKKVLDLGILGNQLKKSLQEDINFTSVISKFAQENDIDKCLLHDKLSPEAVIFRTLTANHWFFGAHLKNSYKEIWFPTHLRFPYIRRNVGKFHRNESIFLPHLPPLNLNNLGFAPAQLNLITQEASQQPENPDFEVESTYKHSVIDKVYRQISPFYIEGQDFDDAQSTDKLILENIAKEAISQALCFFKDKRILISERGFVVMGSNEAKVGDKLCSLWGADVPFIIREKRVGYVNYANPSNISTKSNDFNEVYEIIGECFIDGIMHGELYSKSDGCNTWAEKERHLYHKIQPHLDWVQKRGFKIA
ncbi:putative heterokaryon incompatibility protein [Erysiphe necator]|uniref:Putative heterokaryon incompatibility protein n=1 Tax=Uncinula necator TaxID=52586 RepID=A0A0B1NZ06_UNCNE|nr:putative heterokaryon incompatibility protein [Erysiphe necator]